mmetsp:Transcript_23188/g.50021  ORF Transcript_23188/g.50021 Transcript_23188/m.50021 type:complete len:289 (-) Transcript_23188:1384-2250(-)
MMCRATPSHQSRASQVESLPVERAGVVRDELLARRDVRSHQDAEHPVRLRRVVDGDLLENARLGVHGGGPELGGHHLPEALEPLYGGLATQLPQSLVELRVGVAVGGARAVAHLVERRVGDVHVPLFDNLALVPVEEGEQQRADVSAVDVGVGHEDDPVVSQLRGLEVVALDAEAEAGDEGLHLGVLVHGRVVRLLDIEDLAAEGKDGLRLPRAALLGRAAGGVALYDEDLGEGGVGGGAVGELAGEDGGAEHALPPHELARSLCRLGRLGRGLCLVNDGGEHFGPAG